MKREGKMKLLKEDGFVHRIMWGLYDLIILNLIWILCSIPIISIGASTTALFYCVGKIIRGEDLQVLRDFIKSFKANFKEASVVWLILIIAYFFIYTNFIFFSSYRVTLARVIAYAQLPLFIVVLFISILIFPILSRYNVSILKGFQVSLILSVKYFIQCMICIAIVALGIFSIKFIPAFILFILISSIALGIYGVLNKILESFNEKVI